MLSSYLAYHGVSPETPAGEEAKAQAPVNTRPSSSTTAPPTAHPPADAGENMELLISMSEPEFELCCGVVPTKVRIKSNVTLRNAGKTMAHEVRVLFHLYTAEGDKVSLSGQDRLERYLGDLPSGESRTESVEFTIPLADAYKMRDNGGRGVIHIISEEGVTEVERTFTAVQ